jgi:hypothetical protein
MRFASLIVVVLFILIGAVEADAVPNAGLKIATVVVNTNSPNPKAPADFQFTITRVGDSPLFGFQGSTQTTTIPLTVAAQTVFVLSRVGAPTGYVTTYSGDCGPDGSVSVPPGGVRSCTITNTFVSFAESGPSIAVLRLIKQIDVNNPVGQVPQPGAFTIRVNKSTGPLITTVAGSANGVSVGLASSTNNAYVVQENTNTAFPNYIPTYSGDCDSSGRVTFPAGRIATCTVRNSLSNTREPGANTAVLKVITQVEFNDLQIGTIPQPSQFSTAILRTNNTVATVPGSDTGLNVGLTVGSSPTSFTLNPLPNSFSGDYFPIFSGDCSTTGAVTLQAGQLKTCTVTHTYISERDSGTATALLKIVKQLNSNGDHFSTQPDNFQIEILRGGNPRAQVRGSSEGLSVGLAPDAAGTSYTVREIPNSSSYFPTYSGDCSLTGNVSLQPGQTKTCVVTNSFLGDSESGPTTAVLRVIKLIDEPGAHFPTNPSSFQIGVLNSGNNQFAFFQGSSAGVNVGVAAALNGSNYTVREAIIDQPAGYFPTYSGDCQSSGVVSLKAGEIKTCVVTNSHLDDGESAPVAVVKIAKHVEANDFAGTPPRAEDFFITLFRNNNSVEVIQGSEVGSNISVNQATSPTAHYSVQETVNQPNFIASYSGDCLSNGSISIAAGQTRSCTVTNTYVGGDRLNRPPVALDQTVSLNEDTQRSITVSANDPDGSPISYLIDTLPTHGTLSGNGPTFVYTPEANFNGNDSFSFHAREGDLVSNIATVTLKVLSINDAPVAGSKSAQAIAETPLVIRLTATDVDGDSLTLQITQAPLHGSLNLNGLDVTYTPANNYLGADSFRYVVSDGAVSSNTATVTLTVVNGIVINDFAVGEGSSGITPMIFVVGLLAPSTQTVTAQYTTVNANAIAGQDYTAKSGTISFAPGQTTTSLTISAFGDSLFENNEILLVQLSNPTNAVLKDGVGAGTIVNDDPAVGISSLSPDTLNVNIHQQFNLALTWTHPERWRLLETIDLRLVDEEGVAMWVQFHEPTNTFREINPKNGKPGGPVAPGSSATFQSNTAVMYLQQSSVVGTGPTGPSVTINYNFSFKPKARGRRFRVDVFATDDFGHQQGFDLVGTVTVPPH